MESAYFILLLAWLAVGISRSQEGNPSTVSDNIPSSTALPHPSLHQQQPPSPSQSPPPPYTDQASAQPIQIESLDSATSDPSSMSAQGQGHSERKPETVGIHGNQKGGNHGDGGVNKGSSSLNTLNSSPELVKRTESKAGADNGQQIDQQEKTTDHLQQQQQQQQHQHQQQHQQQQQQQHQHQQQQHQQQQQQQHQQHQQQQHQQQQQQHQQQQEPHQQQHDHKQQQQVEDSSPQQSVIQHHDLPASQGQGQGQGKEGEGVSEVPQPQVSVADRETASQTPGQGHTVAPPPAVRIPHPQSDNKQDQTSSDPTAAQDSPDPLHHPPPTPHHHTTPTPIDSSLPAPPHLPPPSLPEGIGGMVEDTVVGEVGGGEGGSEGGELGGRGVDEGERGTEEEGEGVKNEDFQTFGEWRKKVLEEELERENEKVKQEASQRESQPSAATNGQKLRVNYASEKCGAKVVNCNPEMENGNHMLTANKDEYMINPCAAKKWFIIELCEPIMVKTVEVASLELFSSKPRSFQLSLSDRYPSKEWLSAGKYEMSTDKVPQLYSLSVKSPYVKFIRVDMLDHYGKEHFCPITLFRVFGLPMEDDDDDSVHDHTQSEEEPTEESETLFARTKATVVSLVNKVFSNDKQQPSTHSESNIEIHANFSGDDPLPCDPDLENERLEEKETSASPVTVLHPQPTVDGLAATAEASVSSGEVPMVTQLQEGEQLEMEEKSKGEKRGGQGLVTLLQSGHAHRWQRALHLCDPGVGWKAGYSPNNARCRYAQTLLGSPPPLSLPRIPSTPHPVYLNDSVTMETLLQPSFTSSVTVTESGSTHSEEKQPSSIVVQPSWEASRESSHHPTSSIPPPPPSPSSSLLPITTTPTTTTTTQPQHSEQDSAPHGLGSSSSSSKPPLVSSSKPLVASSLITSSATSGLVVETDPGDGPASVSAEGEETKREELSQATCSQSVKVKASEEDLQPSLDTPALHSPTTTTTTRPTPVLSLSLASVGGHGGVGGERERDTASLAPSPTSHTPLHPPPESPAYPHVIQPTMEVDRVATSEPFEPTDTTLTISQPPLTPSPSPSPSPSPRDPDLPVTNHTHPSTNQSEGEKKGAELDLVTVPLTLSAKRESAVMRLTNRIKALELNVSLSSRFLEELSARFKKQNEEMMKMMNKTMTRLNTTTATNQRQMMHQEQRLDHLEHRLDNLTESVQKLSQSFDNFTQQMSDRQNIFTTLNLLVLVVTGVLFCLAMQRKPVLQDLQFLLDTMPSRPPPPSSFPRRNSDLALNHAPSLSASAALKKGGSLANLASSESTDKTDTLPKKKKRRKNRTQKPVSMDTDNARGADSDPGHPPTGHGGHGGHIGHRRSGSATASFFSLTPDPATPTDGDDKSMCAGGVDYVRGTDCVGGAGGAGCTIPGSVHPVKPVRGVESVRSVSHVPTVGAVTSTHSDCSQFYHPSQRAVTCNKPGNSVSFSQTTTFVNSSYTEQYCHTAHTASHTMPSAISAQDKLSNVVTYTHTIPSRNSTGSVSYVKSTYAVPSVKSMGSLPQIRPTGAVPVVRHSNTIPPLTPANPVAHLSSSVAQVGPPSSAASLVSSGNCEWDLNPGIQILLGGQTVRPRSPCPPVPPPCTLSLPVPPPLSLPAYSVYSSDACAISLPYSLPPRTAPHASTPFPSTYTTPSTSLSPTCALPSNATPLPPTHTASDPPWPVRGQRSQSLTAPGAAGLDGWGGAVSKQPSCQSLDAGLSSRLDRPDPTLCAASTSILTTPLTTTTTCSTSTKSTWTKAKKVTAVANGDRDTKAPPSEHHHPHQHHPHHQHPHHHPHQQSTQRRGSVRGSADEGKGGKGRGGRKSGRGQWLEKA